jgi:hypothetical protein
MRSTKCKTRRILHVVDARPLAFSRVPRPRRRAKPASFEVKNWDPRRRMQNAKVNAGCQLSALGRRPEEMASDFRPQASGRRFGDRLSAVGQQEREVGRERARGSRLKPQVSSLNLSSPTKKPAAGFPWEPDRRRGGSSLALGCQLSARRNNLKPYASSLESSST